MLSGRPAQNEKKALYRFTSLESYDLPAHIFALDYYEPTSGGKDEFSRKEALFYHMGGEELSEEFSSRMEEALQDLFVNNTMEWDYFSLAPSSKKNGLNENMLKICTEISSKAGIEYKQVLRRKRSVNDSDDLISVKQMVINQQDSVEVKEDVEGDNIIILDNVSVSGVSLTYITQLLYEAGAKNVCCLCLGVTNREREVVRMSKGETASKMIKSNTQGDSK